MIPFRASVENSKCKTIKQKACYTTEILGHAGRTSAWWDNFVNQTAAPPEEWRESFRLSQNSLYSLAKELRSYIEGTLLCFHRFSVFVWTGENDSNTLRVDASFFENGENNFRFQKYPDRSGRGLIVHAASHSMHGACNARYSSDVWQISDLSV